MKESLYKFEIGHINDKGNFVAFKEYAHDGRIFVEARKDSKFALRILNDSFYRIEAVMSVDGLSVIDGKTATEKSVGYAIKGLASSQILGWRTSLNDVSQFVFSEKGESLSNQTGYGTKNVGVISCRIYSEYVEPYIITYTQSTNDDLKDWYETGHCPDFIPSWTNCSNRINLDSQTKLDLGEGGATQTCNFMSDISERSVNLKSKTCTDDLNFDMGTSWGKQINDKVEKTSFKRDKLIYQFDIYYGSKELLEKLGIELDKTYKITEYPEGFNDNFCKLPYKK